MTEIPVKPGCLYVVATPLGNLDDITFRAVEVLRAVDVIACEDTRHSRKLLSRYGIFSELISYHDHNESAAAARLAAMLADGKAVALITDAGTPAISDPGYRIASLAAGSDIQVVPVPGPSSLTAALSVAGLPTDSFYFAGFLPAKQKATEDTFRSLKDISATLVFFCPARRLLRVLDIASGILGRRGAAVCREMTKVYEEILRGELAELADNLRARSGQLRGEVVLIIGGLSEEKQEVSESDLSERLTELLESVEGVENMGARQLTALAAERLGIRRNQLYPLVCAWLNQRQRKA